MTNPAVSIVIPTRNGARTLPGVLAAIRRQQVAFEFEIVAVDSGSTDETVKLLHQAAARILTIAPAAFDHGLTRNLAIGESRGDLIVLLVQDAEPASDTWLTALTAPLLADASIAGSFARQLPRVDASALTKYYLSRWVAASGEARSSQIADPADFEHFSPMERFERCIFDNVCSCIRRSVWTGHPFESTPIGEDLAWARDVLLAGHRLVFVPAAEVFHSHDRTARYELARTYVLHRQLHDLFGLRTIPSIASLVRSTASTLRLHFSLEKSVRSAALAFAWPLGQYLGGLSGAHRWTMSRLQGV